MQKQQLQQQQQKQQQQETKETKKIEIFAKLVNGIIQYVDKEGNQYDVQDVLQNKKPRIIHNIKLP
jgi:hypothetical protein